MSPKTTQTNPTTLLFLTILILTNHIHQTTAYITLTNIRTLLSLSRSFSSFHTLLSLSHTLVSRVANLRHSRGDFAGSRRAQLIASKLELGLDLRFWPTVLSIVWRFAKNYSWSNPLSLQDAADLKELLSLLAEFLRLKNDSERAAWVAKFYGNVRRVSLSLFSRLLSVFNNSGFLREMAEVLKKEMEEGDFIKDCLEVGSNDLKGVTQIFQELASQYTAFNLRQEL